METVKSNLQNVVSLLAEKETEIKRLEERLTKMEEEMKKFSKDGPKISQETHEAEAEPVKLLKCEYWCCDYTAKTSTVMKRHITRKHKVDESFKYPGSCESHCEECEISFMDNHTYARHFYEVHKEAYNCVHCDKYLPGDDHSASIHLKVCTAPCDDHPMCPCKLE